MIEAVVQAGPFETPYRRAGTGGTVLLLMADDDPAGRDRLFDQLAGRFRTIAPELPGELAETPELMAVWLRGLIDGLGLDRPAIVAGPTYAAPLRRFAELDPDRVGRLALVREPDVEVARLLDDPPAGQAGAATRRLS
jgi:pimeloyl-ACP methyl ester carboxylesterase